MTSIERATALNQAMAQHPAGKRARRPGVRAVVLPCEPQTIVLESVIGGGFPRTAIIAPQVKVLECIVCGALLLPGSPLSAAHVEAHRGPRWRRSIRDLRIKWRLR